MMQGPAGEVRVLQLHVTRRCNLACAHCYSSSGPHAAGELPLDLAVACVGDAAWLGYTQLAVSGGEPLLYPALDKLLAFARMAGMTTTVTTNGMLLTPERLVAIAPHLDFMAVSIDGSPEGHDALRGQQGAFARTVANLERLRAAEVPFGFIFTLTQHNVDSLESVVRLAAEHGARGVQVHPLTLQGRASERLAGARPDGYEQVAAVCEAQRLAAELGVAIHVDTLLLEQAQAFRERLVPRRPVRAIVDAAPMLIVEPDSTVVPLTHDVDRALALGRLCDAPLSELAESWLAAGNGERLARACARAWLGLGTREEEGAAAVYWYDEVARRTREATLRAA